MQPIYVKLPEEKNRLRCLKESEILCQRNGIFKRYSGSRIKRHIEGTSIEIAVRYVLSETKEGKELIGFDNYSIRQASRKEDMRSKIDMWISTPDYEIPIDIKSLTWMGVNEKRYGLSSSLVNFCCLPKDDTTKSAVEAVFQSIQGEREASPRTILVARWETVDMLTVVGFVNSNILVNNLQVGSVKKENKYQTLFVHTDLFGTLNEALDRASSIKR